MCSYFLILTSKYLCIWTRCKPKSCVDHFYLKTYIKRNLCIAVKSKSPDQLSIYKWVVVILSGVVSVIDRGRRRRRGGGTPWWRNVNTRQLPAGGRLLTRLPYLLLLATIIYLHCVSVIAWKNDGFQTVMNEIDLVGFLLCW